MKRLVALALLAMPASSAAQDSVVREPDRVVHAATTHVDFGDAVIDGELARPDHSYVLLRRGSVFESLIVRRSDFVPELQRSTDHL